MPCNNDLLAGNFIDDGEKVWLIDYEYSGNNDPCFELGNTWTECKLDPEHLDEMVAAYFGDGAEAQGRPGPAQALVAQYGWSLWGFIQNAVSPIDFDFWGCGMERYEGAVSEMEPPGLPSAAAAATEDA